MNKSTPLISIVTPSFNQGQFIEQTINSVLNQTYNNIEYIIVDGDSTDNTMEIVNRYKDKVNVIISEKDKGQTDAINKGFKLANGELLGWINSDDLLDPECIQEIVNLYNINSNGSIYYGDLLNDIDKKGVLMDTKKRTIPSRNFLLNKNYSVIQQGSFYAKNILIKCNYLDENIHFCMDLDLWLKLLSFGPIYIFQKKPLASFRRWEGAKTSTGNLSFLREVRLTLLKHGTARFSRNMRRIYWYTLKGYIKKIIK